MHGGVSGANASEYAEASVTHEDDADVALDGSRWPGPAPARLVRCAWDAAALPRFRPNCTAPFGKRCFCVGW